MAPNVRPTSRCPQCGAPVLISSPAVVLALCEYCHTALYWDEEGIRLAGEQARLTEGFTRLYRGAAGELEGAHFEVLGRVRYRSERGFWDEWWLDVAGGESVWLTEDDHELALQTRLERDVSHLVGLRAGQRFELDGVNFEVDEVGEAACGGIEGQLPERMLTGETYGFLDASSLDGRLALGVELDDQPPSAFRGRWLPHEAVRLADAGDEW